MPLDRVENGKLTINIRMLFLIIAVFTIIATLLTTTVTVSIGYADMNAQLKYVVEDRALNQYRYAGKDAVGILETKITEGEKRRDDQYTEIQRRLCAIESALKKHTERSLKK